MGNICRSPTAEGVFRKLLAEEGDGLELHIDSAGTHGYHVGESPDPRATEAALNRGIDISDQRARAVEISDFKNFELILAMDQDNLELLQKIQPKKSRATVKLLMNYSRSNPDGAVPDPYYGGRGGFEEVLDLLDEVGRELLNHLRSG
jgi:protein-tyrosine phosphatase